MQRLRLTALFALPLITTGLIAQENGGAPISISGQLRIRSELDDRGLTQDESTLMYLLRTRLRATSSPAHGVTVVAELQDSRHFGSGNSSMARGTTDASADALDMRLAYAQIEGIFDLPIDLCIGRQELAFNNSRLIGESNWSNTGRSFDAARTTLTSGDVHVDLFAARLTAPTPSPTESQNLYGLWGTWNPSKALHTELYALGDNNTALLRRGADSGESYLARYTTGLYLNGSVGAIDFEIEAIGQGGRSGTSDSTARSDIRAFLASGLVSVLLIEGSSTRLQGLLTVLSGDGSAGDTVDETFNTLFGSSHKFYGTIDYLPALSGSMGLVDMSGGITTRPSREFRASIDVHLFQAQRRGNGEAFGTEFDLQAWWRGVTSFALSGGGAIFLPGELTKARLGEDPRFWVFLAGQWEI